MIAGVQILGVMFGLGILYLAFISFKRSEFTPTEWGFWTLLSGVVVFISLFPGFLDPLVNQLKFARALDLYVILGFMFLISSLFYVYTVSRKTQRQVEELVRKTAINETLKTMKNRK